MNVEENEFVGSELSYLRRAGQGRAVARLETVSCSGVVIGKSPVSRWGQAAFLEASSLGLTFSHQIGKGGGV